MKNNKEYIKWGLTAFFVVLGGIISYYIIFHLDNLTERITKLFVILMPIIDGIILGYLMTPIVNAIERSIVKPVFKKLNINHKKSQRRTISIVIIIFGNFGIIFFFLCCNSADWKQYQYHYRSVPKLCRYTYRMDFTGT